MGALAQFGKLGAVRQWSPPLLLQYFFSDARAKFRPYIGIGVTRTRVSDARITNTAFETQALGGPTTVESTAEWAPVFNFGFTFSFTEHCFAGLSVMYILTEHCFAGLSVMYIPIDTTSTFVTQAQTPVGTLTRRAEMKVSLDPIVTYMRVGYRF